MKLNLTLTLALLALVTSCASTGSANTGQSGAQASEKGWRSRLIHPVTAPTTFETPVIDSSLNAMVMHHEFPKSSIFGGGDANIYALQVRYAVSDRVALIATKDGYIDLNPNVGANQEGFADIAGGFKVAAIDDPENGFLLTPGLIYETKSGDREVFQGNGDGVIRPFVSAGWDLDEINVLGSFAYNFPIDTDAESTLMDYHLHLDYEATENLFPLFEVNGITYTSNGAALPVNFEGGDLINLGANNVAGNTVISGALGARYKLNEQFMFGLAYEWPLTSRKDILENRITFDLLFFF